MDLSPEQLSQMMNLPVAEPPPGVTADFNSTDSIAYQTYIAAGLCMPLMVIFSGFRLTSQIYLNKRTAVYEEVIFVTGLLFCLTLTTMILACVSDDDVFGKPSWNVMLGAFTKSQLVLSLLVEILSPIAICLVKVSVLLLYFHIFNVIKWMRYTSVAGIVVITIFHVGSAITFGVLCSPSTGNARLDFLAAFVSEKCTGSRLSYVIQGVGNAVIDVFLLVLPLPAVWTLQVPLKRKLAISSMFLVGISACVSSIAGLVYRVQFFKSKENSVQLVVHLWVTTITEVAAGVIICCMPTIPAILKLAKEPLCSWLASSNRMTQRFTKKSPRSDPTHPRFRGKSMLNDSLERADSRATWEPIRFPSRCHHSGYNVWIDSQGDAYSLHELDATSAVIERRTEICVSREEQR